ncbi:MAG TPA: potassium channel family protein [Candidatus Thermoplasmatota archaeon]|nr:potassium channel family protein [Candidatus Thermoplasmatota archaeon]
MPILETAAVGGGIALVLLGLADAFLTILHPDWDGPVSTAANRLTWRAAVTTARAWPKARREALSLAGPFMVLSDVLLWITVPIVGYALIVWPFMDTAFDTPPGVERTFVDALYFSGVTFTSLGFGDITPTSPLWELLAVSEAVSGLLVMSAAIAYIVSVFEGVDQRDALALRVYSETGGTWDGNQLLQRSLEDEGLEVLRKRLEALAEMLRELHGRLYRFHGLAFYLRTRGLRHGPERMLYALTEVALSANLLARAPGLRPLRPAAEHFTFAFEHFASAVIRRHGTREARRLMRDPEPAPEDASALAAEWRALATQLRLQDPENPPYEDPALLVLTARKRIFLEQVDQFTCWKSLRDDAGERP